MGLLSAVAVAGCTYKMDLPESVEQKLTDISSKQDKILAALDKIKNAPAAAPAPRPQQQPGRPDPEKVYSVPVEGAWTKGPATAKVTIAEVSEFQ